MSQWRQLWGPSERLSLLLSLWLRRKGVWNRHSGLWGRTMSPQLHVLWAIQPVTLQLAGNQPFRSSILYLRHWITSAENALPKIIVTDYSFTNERLVANSLGNASTVRVCLFCSMSTNKNVWQVMLLSCQFEPVYKFYPRTLLPNFSIRVYELY